MRATAMTGVSHRRSSSTTAGIGLRFVDEPAAGLWILCEVAEEAVERRRHGVETGHQEEEADVEDLLVGEAVAVDLGVQDVAEEVVASFTLALTDNPAEVRVDRIGRLLLVRVGLGMAELVPYDDVRADHAVLHAQERRELVVR